MKKVKRVQHSWLMIVRGASVGLMGVLLLSFTGMDLTSAYGIGILLLTSGASAIWFGVANRPTQDYALWLIIGGLLEAGFGVAALVMADGSLGGVIDLVGFWALAFAVSQAAQAIYSYIGPSGVGFDSTTKLIHVLLVIASAWLAFALLMVPGTGANLAGMTGLLLIVMGGLLIVMNLKQRNKAVVNASAGSRLKGANEPS